MKLNSNKRILLVTILSIILVNIGVLRGLCKDKDEDQKEFIKADNVVPQDLSTFSSRSYDEGITIKEIELKGNNLIKNEDILAKLNLKVGSKFDRDVIQQDLKSIYAMGYFTERLKAVPQSSPTGIKLRIEMEENTPVTGFNISGNKAVSTADLSRIFNTQTGLPQNIAELNKAVEEIEKLYVNKGYILARVKKISDDPDGMINIDINEGVIESIKIKGNVKTKDFVVKRNMLTSTGTPYNENILKQDISRIFNTQAFSDVRRVITASPDNPDKYQLTVEVDEKRTGAVSFGGGIDTTTGLFGSMGYSDNNFRGVGQRLSTNFTAGTGVMLNNSDTIKRAAIQMEANFVEPRLKQTLNSLELSAFARDYASFQIPLGIERRIGSEMQLSRPIKRVPNLAGSIGLGVESVKIREGDAGEIASIFSEKGIDIGERAKQLQGGTFVSLGPSLVYDTRNNILNPTSGWIATTSFKESIAVSGASGSFGKFEIGARKYIPIGKKSTFTIGAKTGTQVIGNMPEFATFRLGGANTIRGFREGAVGNGRGYMLASAEARTPIPFIDKVIKVNFVKNMRTAFFLDAGTVFRESLANNLFDKPGYGVTAGMGLRVSVPGLGPVKVDYGYPLTFIGDRKRTGRFTFGFGDKW